MTKNLSTTMKNSETKQRLVDFFWVYYDAKTAKNVDRHPEVAIPILREAISSGISPRERLHVYAGALRDAVTLQGVGLGK